MHAVGVRCIVPEDNFDCVAHGSTEDWTHDSEVRVLGAALLERRKRGVCVFAIHRLLVNAAYLVRTGFGEAFGDRIKFHAHGFIAAGGGVVPLHFIGGYVVDARGACGFWRRGMDANRARAEERTDHTQEADGGACNSPLTHLSSKGNWLFAHSGAGNRGSKLC